MHIIRQKRERHTVAWWPRSIYQNETADLAVFNFLHLVILYIYRYIAAGIFDSMCIYTFQHSVSRSSDSVYFMRLTSFTEKQPRSLFISMYILELFFIILNFTVCAQKQWKNSSALVIQNTYTLTHTHTHKC